MRSPGLLVEDLKQVAFVQLHSCTVHQRPNRISGPTLPADQLADVGLGDL